MEFSSISENSTSECRAIVLRRSLTIYISEGFRSQKNLFSIWRRHNSSARNSRLFRFSASEKLFTVQLHNPLKTQISHSVNFVFFANIHCASQCWNEWVEWKMGRVTTIVNFDSICLFIKKPSPFLLCNRLSIASSHHYYHERRHTNSERHALVLWPRSHDHDHHLCSSWSAIDS